MNEPVDDPAGHRGGVLVVRRAILPGSGCLTPAAPRPASSPETEPMADTPIDDNPVDPALLAKLEAGSRVLDPYFHLVDELLVRGFLQRQKGGDDERSADADLPKGDD